MGFDYRLIKCMPIVGLLLGIAFIITIVRMLRYTDMGSIFITCLMFIALVIGLGFIMIWWDNRPDR